jgi:hypothetical protein
MFHFLRVYRRQISWITSSTEAAAARHSSAGAEAIALAVQQADDLAVFLIRENSTDRASGRFVLVLVRSGQRQLPSRDGFGG